MKFSMTLTLVFCAAVVPTALLAEADRTSSDSALGSEKRSDDKDEGKLTIEASLSPTFALDASSSDARGFRGDRLEDATAKSGVKVTFEAPLSDTLSFSTYMGASTDSDWEPGDGDPSTSAFTAGITFNHALFQGRHWKGSSVISMGLENQRDDIFQEKIANNATILAGVKFERELNFGRAPKSIDFTIQPSIERIESTDPLGERWGPRADVSFAYPLSGPWKIKASARYQLRRFDLVESGSRTHHFLLTTAGLGYSKSFTNGLVLDAGVNLAVRVTDIENTDIIRDKAAILFNPGITLKKSW